jgi:hypothetical protein
MKVVESSLPDSKKLAVTKSILGLKMFAAEIKPEFFIRNRHEVFLLYKLIEEFSEATIEIVKIMNRDDERGKDSRMMFELADVYNTIGLYVAKTKKYDIFEHALAVKRQRILERFVAERANSETENEVENDG